MTEQTQAETVELTVSKETVIKGIKLNDKPGVDRNVVFHHIYNGGLKEGQLQDTSGLRWDGKSPVQMSPISFVDEDMAEYPSTARRVAREEAKKEDADIEEWEEVAMEHWEENTRAALKDEIEVPHYDGGKSVYKINYEG